MAAADISQEIADKLAIREVLEEYCLRLEVNEFDEWLDLFSDDTVYEVFRRELKGKKEMSDMLSLAPHGVHVGGALRIELNGDVAETVQNYAFFADDDSFTNNGWYFRRLARHGDTWKIVHTRVKMQKQTNKPLRATAEG